MEEINTQQVNLIEVDFDPFAGPDIVRLAPSAEPQVEIWTTCMLGGDDASRAFNESVSLRFTGALHKLALDQAWQALTRRHEALHSAFSADGTQMCIFGEVSIPIAYQDYSGATETQQKQAIEEYVKQDAMHVFDLLNGPLAKVGLIKLSNTEHHFTLTAHHIVCDGWSLGILLQDLSALYSAYVQKVEPTLPPAPLYSQFAAEQSAFTKSEAYHQIEQFWVDQYKDSVPVVDLPTDFPRPALRTYKINRLDYRLDGALVKAVKTMGAKAGCSFVTTLMASFEVLIHRLTGQTDISLGLPAAGQSVTGNQGLVGHCVNLLPVRSFPQPDLSFLQFLKQRKEGLLDAYEHQQLTFSSLLRKLSIPRDASRVPLVPVIFNLDMGLDDGVSFHGLTYHLISNPRQYGAVDLFVNIGDATTEPSDSSLVVEWAYNTQLFKAETITRMMDEFESLLTAICADPLIRIEAIPLTDQRELLRKWAKWNNTQAAYPRNSSLPALLTKTAAQSPDKTALICPSYGNSGSQSLSYKELDEASSQAAHYLLKHGVGEKGRSEIIGVVLDRTPELLITLLAILKAGAAYLPIDPDYPQDRITFMLTDSSASMLITSKKYAGRLAHQATEVLIDTVLAEADSYPKVAPTVSISGSDLAYILYTSGSTGKPKGVLIEHRNLVNLLSSMITLPGITHEDVLLGVTTVSFDIAGLELYLPLLVGATLVLADAETAKDGRALLEAIPAQHVTIMQATPATYKMMLAAGWEERLPLKILCCGEPMTKDLAQKLTARCGTLWNMYGPTETTIYSTGKQILATDDIITIGRPIHNTQVYILNDELSPLPEGIVGEIYLAGDGVARGYLNRPALSDEKFVNDPFDASGTKKMYRTGDLGTFLANGEIHCLGRADHQLKIRGYRIEPGEIEQALLAQPTIKDAVVLAREDRPGDQRLTAYLVTEPFLANGAFVKQVPAWRMKLQEVLPVYMVPTDFISLPKLPVTPNGKIDRNALAKPIALLQSEVGDLAQPVTDMEKLITAIWSDTLGIEKIGIDSDFFELGGHSMIAVQMMTRLEKEIDRRIPLSTLLTYPTIRKLAQLLQDDKKTTGWKSLVPIKPEGSKVPIYVIHGIGLNLLNFSSLVAYMDAEQPIYGLQALGLDGMDEPLDNMEEIARFYNTELLDQNPSGPYAIAGYSFGGYVALEMARQLKEMGKEVKLLAMFDTNAEESETKRSPIDWLTRKIIRQFPKMLWFMRSLIEQPVATMRYQKRYVDRHVNTVLEAIGVRTPPPPQPEKGLDLLERIIEKHEVAYQNYTLRPYDGVVDLFKAQVRPYFVEDTKFLGWKKYALNGVRVHSVPGDHELMLLPPNDKEFARKLQDALDNS